MWLLESGALTVNVTCACPRWVREAIGHAWSQLVAARDSWATHDEGVCLRGAHENIPAGVAPPWPRARLWPLGGLVVRTLGLPEWGALERCAFRCVAPREFQALNAGLNDLCVGGLWTSLPADVLATWGAGCHAAT